MGGEFAPSYPLCIFSPLLSNTLFAVVKLVTDVIRKIAVTSTTHSSGKISPQGPLAVENHQKGSLLMRFKRLGEGMRGLRGQ